MIGMLHGQVDFIDAASAIIEVGGVGYETRMPSADLASMHAGQTVKVYTSLNVSQDAITLYGFSSLASKRMFLQLQKVSGIGPKVALSLLSTLPPERLAKAVADGDATALAKAPGLGKKGAQKIILELKGSIDLSQIEGACQRGSFCGRCRFGTGRGRSDVTRVASAGCLACRADSLREQSYQCSIEGR